MNTAQLPASFFTLQQATVAARDRLNDKTIGTRVDGGKVQVVRVTYPNGSNATVTPVSGFLQSDEAIAFLNGMQ